MFATSRLFRQSFARRRLLTSVSSNTASNNFSSVASTRQFHSLNRVGSVSLSAAAISPSLTSSSTLPSIILTKSRNFATDSDSTSDTDFNLFTPSEEHANLRQLVRSWTAENVEPQAADFNKREEFNIELFKRLGTELGLLGPLVSEEYGGAGMEDAVTACIIHEELSYSDPSFCLSYLAHSMLFVHNLYHNGNADQKKRFLPKAVSGDWICGMCMSEPGAGTDVLGLQTRAKRGVCPTTGEKGYVITGNKMWITNGCRNNKGELGNAFLVYANTSQIDSESGESSENWDRKKLSLFLVETSEATKTNNGKGFQLGQKIHDKCGMRASNTTELVFDNCFVPESNLVGNLHQGVIPMMRNLEIERIVLAAMSCGLARRSVDLMRTYAMDRQSFGKPLDSFGQIQQMIADSYAEYMAARSYLYMCARHTKLDSAGQRLDSDGVKLVATKMGTRVCDRAIQVHGGYGYVGEYVVERLWRDAKLLEIGGGTIEAHQKNITMDLKNVIGKGEMAD